MTAWRLSGWSQKSLAGAAIALAAQALDEFPAPIDVGYRRRLFFLVALVAAVVALMQLGAAGGEAAISFSDRLAAIVMVSLLACTVCGLVLLSVSLRTSYLGAKLSIEI